MVDKISHIFLDWLSDKSSLTLDLEWRIESDKKEKRKCEQGEREKKKKKKKKKINVDRHVNFNILIRSSN